MKPLIIPFQGLALLVVLIGVPDVKHVHVQISLNVIQPLPIILPCHFEQHVILIHLKDSIIKLVSS